MSPAVAGDLTFYVVTRNTKDYPDRVVVRKHVLHGSGTVTAVDPPYAIVADLDAARRWIPKHCVKLARHELDDPVIVETWL